LTELFSYDLNYSQESVKDLGQTYLSFLGQTYFIGLAPSHLVASISYQENAFAISLISNQEMKIKIQIQLTLNMNRRSVKAGNESEARILPTIFRVNYFVRVMHK